MSLSNNFPTVSPTLNLNFAAAGRLDSRVTFTRSSTATYTNQIGLIQSAAVNEPRFDYDPVTLAARGLLVEEQRTNNFTYSQLFSNAAWLKDRASVSSSGTAPDGTATSFLLTEDATAGNDHYIKFNATTFTSGTYTMSWFVKKGTRTAVGLRFLGSENNYVTVVFDLTTGLETKRQSAGGFSAISAASVALQNDWYRLSITATASVTFDCAVLLSNSTNPTIGTYGQIAYNGDNASGLYIWGAQLESAGFATSYIPTVAATVTRSADVASVDTLSPWFNATEGTLFAEFSSSGVSYGSIASLFTDVNNLITLINGSGGTGFVIINGGSIQANIGTRSYGSKQIGAYKLNDFASSTNGGAVDTDTSGTVPTITSLRLGNENNGAFMNGHLRRIAYYSARLTNAQLVALTS